MRLEMPGVLEVVVFADVRTEFEVWEHLSQLDKRIPLRWAVPGRPGAKDLGRQGSTGQRVWLLPENSSNVRFGWCLCFE